MKKNKSKRKIDKLAEDSFGRLGKNWTLITRKKILSWKTAIIVAFLAGIAIAIFFVVRFRMQISSDAAAKEASMYLYPNNFTLSKGDSFTTNVYIDTKGNNVVAAQAIVTYNPSELQLVSYDVNNSVFSFGNSCVYNGKPCRIIENNISAGKISLTFGKPTPGVNTSAGLIGVLNFKTLKEGTSPKVTVSFVGMGDYGDSNVIIDDGNGTDILKYTDNASITVRGTGGVACTNFTYSDWGQCVNNSQSRTITSQSPVGCSGGSPVLTQQCATSGKDIPGGGSSVCTDFTYTDWSKCDDGKQSRSVISSGPSNCQGGSPLTRQSCSEKKKKCRSYKYTAWGKCINGKMKRKVISRSPRNCSGGKGKVTTKKCVASQTNRDWWRWW